MTSLDSEWAKEVALVCQSIFDAANVGFVRQFLFTDEQRTRDGANIASVFARI